MAKLSHSPSFECPNCSTCAPTRTSMPTSRRTRTTTGSSITPISSTRPKLVATFLETFKAFPPAQHPGSFTVEDAHSALENAASGANH